MRDDAVAPVIAVMLILAGIVTILSIWNAVYVPSLKASAEVEHLQNVETAFEHFSSDIDYAVSSHQYNLVFSEPVQLGGGDTVVNQIKSSGSLKVQDESHPIYTLILSNEAGPELTTEGTIVNISYVPVSNFWQDQGYSWQYGYINVTKNSGTLATPLDYYNMTDVQNELSQSGSLQTFAQSFVGMDGTGNTTPIQNSTPTNSNQITFSPVSGNCKNVDLWALSISASPQHNFVSSNGFGTLKITSTVSYNEYYDISNISLGSDNSVFGNATLESWNTSFNMLNSSCFNNRVFDYTHSNSSYFQWDIIQSVSPVNVTLHQANIVISAS